MENLCEVVNCHRNSKSRGMCGTHYERWRRENRHLIGSPTTGRSKWNNPDGSRMNCQVPNCPYLVETQGMCSKHYQQFWYESTRGATKTKKNRKRRDITGEPLDLRCTFPGCRTVEFNPGLCAGHYYQKLRFGKMLPIHDNQPCPVKNCEGIYSTLKGRNNVCAYHSSFCLKYNIPESRLVELFDEGVCGNPGCESGYKLHIDHDHSCCPYGKEFPRKTQKSCGDCVRGLLCGGCNSALGQLQENPRAIQGLLEYLELHQKSS